MSSEQLKLSTKRLGLIGLFGALGGAINAWLCYAKFPVAIEGVGGPMEFSWVIIPSGAAHGALLATIPSASAFRLRSKRWPITWSMAPVVGWFSGWLSWAAIEMVMNLSEYPLGVSKLLEGLSWPIREHPGLVNVLGSPFLYFGLVGFFLYLLLLIPSHWKAPALWKAMTMSIGSGVLGSLWWWMLFGRWWFAFLHGTIWGTLVGFGVWKATRQGPMSADEAVFRGPAPRDLSRRHDDYLYGPD